MTHWNAPIFQHQNAEKTNLWFKFKGKNLVAFTLPVVSITEIITWKSSLRKNLIMFHVNFMVLLVTEMLMVLPCVFNQIRIVNKERTFKWLLTVITEHIFLFQFFGCTRQDRSKTKKQSKTKTWLILDSLRWEGKKPCSRQRQLPLFMIPIPWKQSVISLKRVILLAVSCWGRHFSSPVSERP